MSDGFEGFRAGCVCLDVMRQGFRVETPEFGSKRPLYIGYYVVLKYDEVSKIMVPQIAWSSIHLIAGTSIWWNCHLLVRWWLGMILHSLKRIAGDQRDQKTCAPRCFVPCAKPVAMRRHWNHITDGVRVFLLTDSLGEAKQSWLMTKQAHISCFQTSLCSKFFSSGCGQILAIQACLKMTKVKGAGFKHSAHGWANHPSGKPCWNWRLLV